MAVTHTKSLTGPDGVNPDRAQPSDWNANHTVDLSDYAGPDLPGTAIPADHSGSTHAATQAAAEATAAAANTADIATHAAIVDSHHAKYTDAEAVAAVVASGSWTPVLTFATPGNLSVAYSTQAGTYVRIGDSAVIVTCNLVTSTFTHTTASGAAYITGLPFTCAGSVYAVGRTQGWTDAATTDFAISPRSSTTYCRMYGVRGGAGIASITTAHLTSGTQQTFYFTAIYEV